MAIVFLQEKRTQKNLILIFVIMATIILFVIWQGFFKKEKPTQFLEETRLPSKKEVKINFEILKNPLLRTLQPFSEISPFKETEPTKGKPAEKLGRENPFIPPY